MKRMLSSWFFLLALTCSQAQTASRQTVAPAARTLTLSKEKLLDKIKGGWAGQTIGVTFGGPYEFRFNGTFIQDYQPLVWYEGYLKETMLNNPGLYDDLYMDLTFVDVFEKHGLDAPVDSFASAFAHAGYMLWHANQAARYNILNGIRPPLSGHWWNNPHADDIDYQIESDFAGLMSPGMPNTASAISDRIGHIMNYGDGWYGGVFVGALYTQAFVSDNVRQIISEALKTIPKESTFYQCMADVIRWHQQYPSDWHRTWFELQKKWSSEVGCPEGVFNALNIDAKINAAYIVLGLLYGQGDFGKSIEITTRAGQDADCNPSSVAGILGTLIGYERIPPYWKLGLKEIEDLDFKYTTMSLNKVYQVGMKHALQNIEQNGGKVSGDQVTIALQSPRAVRLEQSFAGIYPAARGRLRKVDATEWTFAFEGSGVVVRGDARRKRQEAGDAVIEAEFYIDGSKVETSRLPTAFTTRRYELFWKYNLPQGKHTVRIKVLNPVEGYELNPWEYLVYRNGTPQKPVRTAAR